MKLIVTAQARQDLHDIEEYIGKDNPIAAIHFMQKLTEHFLVLRENPGIGSNREQWSAGLRSISVGNYLIVYRTKNQVVTIIHVVHAARDIPKLFKFER